MLGLILTAVFCFLAASALRAVGDRWFACLDPHEGFGLAGLICLGLVGTVTTTLGLIPGFLKPAMVICGGITAIVGILALIKQRGLGWQATKPTGWALPAAMLLGILLAIPLLGVLTPGTSMDWDSLAYHLAVPKLWLGQNHVYFISTIHHSNFPFAVDSLYLYGLSWGGEAGAKAFNWCILLLGCQALYGLSRRWNAGPFAILAPIVFAAVPVVIWEAGTAYIDGAHALYVGLAALYSAELVMLIRRSEAVGSLPILAGFCWGLAMGTKLTGLQTFFVAGLCFVLFGIRDLRSYIRPAGIVAGLALLVASPWFIKNIAFTGNPVFPFFYEVLGGKGWDSWRAEIYANEQKSFGVGSNPLRIGHAILGLSYQPGRYVNPAQQIGGGMPTGAIGLIPLVVYVAWCVSGRLRGREAYLCAWAGLSLGLWFLLTQQSRYLAFIAVPAAVLLALAQIRFRPRTRIGPVLMGLAILQALVSIGIVYRMQGENQLRVLTGQVSAESYRHLTTPFSRDAEAINELDDVKEVALYDEVFGYFLDRPYFWANPGHGDRIRYEDLESGADLARALKEEGISHVYVSLRIDPDIGRWLAEAGLAPGEGYTPETRESMLNNRELRWKILLADAVREGHLEIVPADIRGGALFRVR